MSDDLELAGLLGEAPRTPDPGFRFDVLSRTSQRARRRASRQRASRLVLASTLIGLVFPLARAFGVGFAEVQPLLLVAGVLGLAYVLALLTLEGPRAVLARSRAVLRGRL
jgi:fatty acid desaturase